MTEDSDRVPLYVRCIHACEPGTRKAKVILASGRHPDSASVNVSLEAGDLHALLHELCGEETTRTQALALVRRVADALGGRLTAALLSSHGTSLVGAAIEVETGGRRVRIPTEPGQAIGLSVQLGIPLLGDRRLLQSPGCDTPWPLGGSVDQFLKEIELKFLGEEQGGESDD